ncbi:uncharacterized protein MKK02DRAFT_39415 [Dioszegia hungarica]|uniref:Uncharacterized protein n=1 Tax=Dioszegia hungarica TaxID=4972 RepID=A0AA38LWV6_9TREE|nr:uncharacterized protein MKK02DRAFT_39415 [Dioszegia hungarica]KAI9639132.1 hypothetical protein MKK02DRAFT_39415 [Dioszegia hungarica]
MVSALRQQRSQPFPSPDSGEEPRWSGKNLPANGYSSLFTSGLMRSSRSPLTPPPPIRTSCYRTPPRLSPSIDIDMSSPAPAPAVSTSSADTLPFPQAAPYRPSRSPQETQRPSPARRLPSSPSKLRAPPAIAADRALTDVIHKLRLYASNLSPAKAGANFASPSPAKQSRWSSSSEESNANTGEEERGEAFWRPRKSGESTRSKASKVSKAGTVRSVKSKKSVWSLKSRRSEDGERPEHGEERPPMPSRKDVPVFEGVGMKGNGKGKNVEQRQRYGQEAGMEQGQQAQMPTTPGRGRRVVEGLARRLGLTPKKKNIPPTPSRSGVHTGQMAPPPLPTAIAGPTLPLPSTSTSTSTSAPTPVDPNLPQPTGERNIRKSSLSTLRSLAKKTSTGTLRSVRSIYGHPPSSSSTLPEPPMPFTSASISTLAFPPALPPTTPRRPALGKKGSMGPIGQPKAARPSFSPSLFDSVPRRAPKTPDRCEEGAPAGSVAEAGVGPGGEGDREGMKMMDVDEIITFASTSFPSPPHTGLTPVDTLPATLDNSVGQAEYTLDSTYSPALSTPRALALGESSPVDPIEEDIDMDTEFNFHEFLTSTPVSQRLGLGQHRDGNSYSTAMGWDTPPGPVLAGGAAGAGAGAGAEVRGTPPLTLKAARAQLSGSAEKGTLGGGKTKSRLMDLLPTYSRHAGMYTGSSDTGSALDPAPHAAVAGAYGSDGAAEMGKEKDKGEGAKARFKKSFSRSRTNASTPALVNGLPAAAATAPPAPAALLPPRTASRVRVYPRLGTSTHPASTLPLNIAATTAARDPLGPLPLPNINTNTRPVVSASRAGPFSREDVPVPASHTKPQSTSVSPAPHARPATSMGHHPSHHRTRTPYQHPPFRPGTSLAHNKRDTFDADSELNFPPFPLPLAGPGRQRVPDFSRPMSKQDLSFESFRTARANQPGEDDLAVPMEVSMDFPVPSYAKDKDKVELDLDFEQGDEEGDVDGDHTGQYAYTHYNAVSETSPTHTITAPRPASLELVRQGSGGHERMHSNASGASGVSVATGETGLSGVSGMSGVTGVSGTSGTSGGSGWELERYLRDMETDEDEGEGEGEMVLDEGDAMAWDRGRGSGAPGTHRLRREGKGPFGKGGVIQQAKYGIRI